MHRRHIGVGFALSRAMRSRSRLVISPAAWLSVIIAGGIAALFVLIAATTDKEPTGVSGSHGESIAAPAEVAATSPDVRAAESAATDAEPAARARESTAMPQGPAAIVQDTAAIALEPAAMERLNTTLAWLVEGGDIPPLELLEPVESAVVALGKSKEIVNLSGSSLSGLGFETSTPEFEFAHTAGNEAVESGWASGSSRGGAVGFGSGVAGLAGPALSGGGRAVGGGADAPARNESVLAESSTVVARSDTSRGEFKTGNDRHESAGQSPYSAGESPYKPGDAPSTTSLTSLTSLTNGNPSGAHGGNDDPVSVPEPSSLLLTGSGLIALVSAVRRRTGR
jgi:hypothetical protein